MKKTEAVDILALFDDTKKGIEMESVKLAGKAELLDSLINYFSVNNLRVVKDVDVPEEAPKAEKK